MVIALPRLGVYEAEMFPLKFLPLGSQLCPLSPVGAASAGVLSIWHILTQQAVNPYCTVSLCERFYGIQVNSYNQYNLTFSILVGGFQN